MVHATKSHSVIWYGLVFMKAFKTKTKTGGKDWRMTRTELAHLESTTYHKQLEDALIMGMTMVIATVEDRYTEKRDRSRFYSMHMKQQENWCFPHLVSRTNLLSYTSQREISFICPSVKNLSGCLLLRINQVWDLVCSRTGVFQNVSFWIIAYFTVCD